MRAVVLRQLVDVRLQRVDARRGDLLAVDGELHLQIGYAFGEEFVFVAQGEVVPHAENRALHTSRHAVGVREDLGLRII